MHHRSVVVVGAALALAFIVAAPLTGQRGGEVGPAEPAPRFPDGHMRLGPAPGEAGLWVPIDARLSVSDDGSARGPRAGPNAPRYPNFLYSEVPFKPWARAILDYRLQNPFEPHARCKPSGGARQPLTPYGIELFEIRELQRAYLMDLGGPHTYRIIYMDGREHPAYLTPSYYGHSIGWWEDETFVVDTIGFNERFWIDREGMPHTEQLHTIERYERIDAESMLYTITVDDPGAYTEEWTGGFYMRWSAGEELFEYVCQDNNFANVLMIGNEESVDRTSIIIP